MVRVLGSPISFLLFFLLCLDPKRKVVVSARTMMFFGPGCVRAKSKVFKCCCLGECRSTDRAG